MKPPFPYFGGKQRLARRIASLLPEHRHYVEPFGGSLAVLLAKEPSPVETVNDLDGDVLFWRVLRERPDELAAMCALTPHARAEHRAAFDREVDDEVERARRIWVLLTQGRSSRLTPVGWRYFAKPNTPMPAYLAAYAERIPPAAWRLRRVSIECRPGLELVADYGRHHDVCLYIDCPYEGRLRVSNYRHEMRGEAEHVELAEALHSCRSAVVISGYPSSLYDRLYSGWSSVTFKARAGGDGDGDRTEVLWSNRPLTQPTLDLDAAGAPA